MDSIFYVLRTGCQWKALPREFGTASTVHDRLQLWRASGVFARRSPYTVKAHREHLCPLLRWLRPVARLPLLTPGYFCCAATSLTTASPMP
jgi:transposase